MNEELQKAINGFQECFGRLPETVVSAPGRINLIGEHTDYNEGLVLPTGIGKRTYAAGSKEVGEGLKLASSSFTVSGGQVKSEPIEKGSNWKDYPKGVYWELERMGYEMGAAAVYFHSNIPTGAGLSSSAAIEVATAGCLRDLFNLKISDLDIAKASQRAENDFVGVNCGLMDQMASSWCKRNHALFIDFRNMHHELVPLEMPGASIVVADSGSKRELASSKYNERRAECEAAAEKLGINSLRYAEGLKAEILDALPNPLRGRAKHIVEENTRVRNAVDALKAGELTRMGELMLASHTSLRDLYEVSSPELDFLVETAQQVDGTYGARLTGAGFGGCTINLVESRAVPELTQLLSSRFKECFGRDIYIFETSPGNGLTRHQF